MDSISNFDPNSVAQNDNIFGLPFNAGNAQLILIPVPWEVTVSYRSGTVEGPYDILEASKQVDLYDEDVPDVWKKGIYFLDDSAELMDLNDDLRDEAEEIITSLEEGEMPDDTSELDEALKMVNDGCRQMNDWVYVQADSFLNKGKKVGLIGGDHSTPYGFIKALAQRFDDFGILQIDAHADLRIAYEGFTYSHASIMYNVLTDIPQVKKLVQIGIRDYCDAELNFIKKNPKRINTFFDASVKRRQYEGITWKEICLEIIACLPQNVYVSFDIDGLDPKLCPNTGTPVPGGFETEQIFYLFKLLNDSGKKIIGFDLNEVSSGDNMDTTIDGITGARVLYKLCNYLLMD